MPMYALATIPLIKNLDGNYKQMWYADDTVAAGRLWICATGGIGYLPWPGFVYFPNASKTWLVTKEGFHDAAVSIFANTGVNVTPNGRPYLGAAIGSQEYVAGQVESKVNEWIS